MALLYRDPQASAGPPAYLVKRSPADPFRGGDGAWAAARVVEWGPAAYRTRFRALWSSDALFVRFDCMDDGPWHTLASRDDHLWEEEVVEIFIDPASNGEAYVEIEISPANTVCDLRIDRVGTGPMTDIHWDFEGLETQVIPWRRDEATATDWTAIAALPWAGFRTVSRTATPTIPPGVGTRWKFNVFRIKRPGGPAAPERDAVYAAWSVPAGSSFHAPSAFRDLVFE